MSVPKHPALAEFPTDGYSTWQWWYLIHRAGALCLDQLPEGVPPIVRAIDDWDTAHSHNLVAHNQHCFDLLPMQAGCSSHSQIAAGLAPANVWLTRAVKLERPAAARLKKLNEALDEEPTVSPHAAERQRRRQQAERFCASRWNQPVGKSYAGSNAPDNFGPPKEYHILER